MRRAPTFFRWGNKCPALRTRIVRRAPTFFRWGNAKPKQCARIIGHIPVGGAGALRLWQFQVVPAGRVVLAFAVHEKATSLALFVEVPHPKCWVLCCRTFGGAQVVG